MHFICLLFHFLQMNNTLTPHPRRGHLFVISHCSENIEHPIVWEHSMRSEDTNKLAGVDAIASNNWVNSTWLITF